MAEDIKIDDKELNKRIDDFVKCFSDSITVFEPDFLKTGIDRQQFGYIIRAMEKFDIIKESHLILGETRIYWELTTFGHEVLRDGGWIKHLSDKAEDKAANRQLVKISTRANRLNFGLLIATTIFSFSALVVSYLDFRVHRKELRVAKESLRVQKLELRKQIADSLLNLYPHCNTNQRMNLEMQKTDSLDKKVK